MEALFFNFALLNRSVRIRLRRALGEIRGDYRELFGSSMDGIEREWKQFEPKCPKTVARFIAEHDADAQEFMRKTCPEFYEDVTAGLTREEIKAKFHELIDMRATVVEALREVAADQDEHIIESHIKARLLLTDKFLADQKNTDTLAKLANDEEGSKAEYCKIVVH